MDPLALHRFQFQDPMYHISSYNQQQKSKTSIAQMTTFTNIPINVQTIITKTSNYKPTKTHNLKNHKNHRKNTILSFFFCLNYCRLNLSHISIEVCYLLSWKNNWLNLLLLEHFYELLVEVNYICIYTSNKHQS